MKETTFNKLMHLFSVTTVTVGVALVILFTPVSTYIEDGSRFVYQAVTGQLAPQLSESDAVDLLKNKYGWQSFQEDHKEALYAPTN